MKQSHKTLVLWVMLILMFVAIYNLVAEGEQPRTVDFSEFLADVRSGRVEQVQIKTREHTAEYRYMHKGKESARETKIAIGITGEQIQRELMDQEVKVRYMADDQNGLWGSILVTWIPMIFLLVVFFFFMRQLQASGGKAMSFGKARARLLSESSNKVTFDDVAGIDEAKDDCEEIIAFLKDPKKFQRLGCRIPKGVLLMGPPGTGKTLP